MDEVASAVVAEMTLVGRTPVLPMLKALASDPRIPGVAVASVEVVVASLEVAGVELVETAVPE